MMCIDCVDTFAIRGTYWCVCVSLLAAIQMNDLYFVCVCNVMRCCV